MTSNHRVAGSSPAGCKLNSANSLTSTMTWGFPARFNWCDTRLARFFQSTSGTAAGRPPHLLQFQQITQKFVVEKTVRIEPFSVGAEGFQTCAAKFPELGQKVRVERSCL